jgi:hypothetical protein
VAASNNLRWIAAAAAVVIGAGLIGGAILLRDDESSEDPPASVAGDSVGTSEVGAAPDDACRLRVDSAVITHDPATIAGFAQAGIRVEGISPAVRVGDVAHSMRVVSSTQISCDSLTGYVGLRGGIRWSLGDRAIEMRRMRLDIGNRTMTVFPRSTGFQGIDVSSFDVGAAQRVDEGDRVTITVPLALTPQAAQLINDGLGGILGAADSAAVGTATVTATKVAARE